MVRAKAQHMGKSDTPGNGKSAPVKPTAESAPPNGEQRRRIIEEYVNSLRAISERLKAIWRKHTH
jgi:hypothetical protein